MKEDNLNCVLVLGASGGIGSAIMRQFLEDSRLDKIVAVSREKQPQDMHGALQKVKYSGFSVAMMRHR